MLVRPAAQLAGEEYYAKFEKAIELMKALPADDPRNFMQQANVHCAYCNLTDEQKGDAENWDHPDGMRMPERYARTASPLYDARRNQTHLPPALLDLAYSPRPQADLRF